jgi:hypothetical protein
MSKENFILSDIEGIVITRKKGKSVFQPLEVEPVLKHGTHNQKTHGSKGGGSGSGSAALEYPTKKSNPEMEYMLSDYVVAYPNEAGHEIINGTLRQLAGFDNVTPEYKEKIDFRIEQMDKLVELSPELPEDTVVYRGIGGAFAMDLQAKGVGATFTDNGFTSVSLDRGIARGFPSRPSGNVMEIVLPAGTKAVNPSKFFGRQKIVGNTDLRQEQELILGRGTTFEILSIEDNPFSLGSNFKIGVKQ